MDPTLNLHWYCIKTRPRVERTARHWLETEAEVEVFCPLLSFDRRRGAGKMRVIEAMFPGYLFARFDYREAHRRVRATNGVSTIVNFGGKPAIVPDEVIGQLRAAVSGEETIEICSEVRSGDEVQVIQGPFRGIRALVTRVLPGRERVNILLELLGIEREVEVSTDALLPDISHPLRDQDR
ncbi:MAG: transcription termination/antitermination NusG family protein [Terrimicrobiaceae bacterium]|nr:transcription termination/antitermination NusG family protein [Terrimicrobiaceae bacterium]